MVAWKAVSKQATAGTSGRTARVASRACRDGAWCNGARSPRARSSRSTAASTRTGPAKRVPPWTTRWPTASTAPKPATAPRRASRVDGSRGGGRSAAATSRSWGSSTRNFRLLDPAFTTRIRTGELPGGRGRHFACPPRVVVGVPPCGRAAGAARGEPRGPAMAVGSHPGACAGDRSSQRVWPGPFADLGRVLPVVAGVLAAAQPAVCHLLAQPPRPRREPGCAVDHVHHEVEAVEVVHHDHVEGRGGRAFLLVAADVDRVVRPPTVGQAMDEPRIAVVGEDDGP